MQTRQVIGLSVLSSLLTLLAVFVVLNCSGTAVAQKPVPTPTPLPQVTPQDPNALTVNSERPAMNEALEQPNVVAATTDYQHVAGSAFTPLYGDSGVVYTPNGCTYTTNASHPSSNYPLILPHGSTVTQVRLYFNDTSASINGTLHLARYDDGAAHEYPATLATSGSSGLGSVTVSGLTITLDYINYNYVMYWIPGIADSSMQLCGFRVTYTRPFFGVNFLPAVLKNPGQ